MLQRYYLDPEASEAFEACKDALASATALIQPKQEARLNIAVDASDTAMGAVLLACFSQTLSPQQNQSLQSTLPSSTFTF